MLSCSRWSNGLFHVDEMSSHSSSNSNKTWNSNDERYLKEEKERVKKHSANIKSHAYILSNPCMTREKSMNKIK